jgi:hypothetical protein
MKLDKGNDADKAVSRVLLVSLPALSVKEKPPEPL